MRRTELEGQRQLVLHASSAHRGRALGSAALSDRGFRVIEASEAADTVSQVRREVPDAVLLADDLPGGGRATCEAIRATRAGSEVPLVVLLSKTDPARIDRLFAAGATDVIPAPVNWPLLGRRLQRLLATRKQIEELRRDHLALSEAKRQAFDASDAIHQLKQYDLLTGLPNRTLFADFIGLALARAKRQGGKVGVLFFDIDDFQEINETLGRELGDAVLRRVADRLRGNVRDGDRVARDDEGAPRTMVARLSGDEFVILVDRVSGRGDVQAVADRLLSEVAQPFLVGAREIDISATIGVAVAPDDGEDEETLIQRAETAMFHAKRKGTGQHRFFKLEMKSAVIQKVETKLGLKRALGEDGFELHYQPLQCPNGRLTGLEALIRWRHPQRGLVAPDEFIPIAEETGLMVPIGEWVLRDVCRQLRRWQERGAPPLRLSLNVSASQLEHPGFPAQVAEILAEHGVPADQIGLELSERGVLRDDPALLDRLSSLRDAGIELAIDDFGIGQTSLAYLRRLPLDVIKIDRSFVAGLTRDRDADAIISAILAMARKLELGVVAEGVETAAQAEFLTRQGCDLLQGFYFHRPLPPAALEEALGWAVPRLATA